MKVFISSLISGFEPFRAAARTAVTTLRHEPTMAEDFGARPTSPQLTCLHGVRSADVVLLILGERYGTVQRDSGVSPTHEEFLEAKGRKNILVFVQQGVTPDPQQAKFISEVQAWQGGYFRTGFNTPEQLREAIIQALHDYELANAVAPLDITALLTTATGLLPGGSYSRSGRALLNVAVVGGPVQRILRPAELEDPALLRKLHQQALFSSPALFDTAKGMSNGMEGEAVFLEQPDGGARIRLDEHGSALLRLPLERDTSQRVLSVIIEENVVRELIAALAFASWALDLIDPSQRLTHLALAANIAGADYLGWRTQAEHDASPNSVTVGMGGTKNSPVQGTWPRSALRLEAHRSAEDIMVRLRRIWRTR